MEDGQQHTSVLLNTTEQMYNITVSGVSDCNVTVLVVGGGGRYVGSQTYGGAGSGHLEYRSLQVAAGTVLTARVGTMFRPPASPSVAGTQ